MNHHNYILDIDGKGKTKPKNVAAPTSNPAPSKNTPPVMKPKPGDTKPGPGKTLNLA